MGRILSLPFGLNSLTAGIEIDAITGGTTLSLTSNPISLKYLSGGSDTGNYVDRTIPTTVSGRTYYCRFNFKYHTLPANADGKVFIAALHDTGWYGVAIALTTSGTLQLFEPNTSAQIGTGTSSALTADVWYLVELSYVHSTYTGTARLNGSQFATGANGIGTADISVLTVGHMKPGANNTTAGEWYIKDVAINDDQGSYQNTWPGAGNLIMLRPSATGDSAQWARAGTDTGANWSQCNDTPPSDASYIQATAAALDMYNCTDSGIAAGATVNVVEVGGRFKRSASVSPGFKFRIIKAASGTEALSAEITPTDSTNWRTNTVSGAMTSPIVLYKDPDGSLNWTQTTVDSMQIGVVYATDTNRYVQISEVWAIVDYTAPSYIKFGGAPAVTSGLAGVPKLSRILTAATIAATSVTVAQTALRRLLTAATVTATSALSGQQRLLNRFSGTAVCISSLEGQGRWLSRFSGAAAAASTLTGQSRLFNRFSGVVAAISALEAALTFIGSVTAVLGGMIDAVSALSFSNLISRLNLSGLVDAISSLSLANLISRLRLMGSVAATSALSFAQLISRLSISGLIAATSALSAALNFIGGVTTYVVGGVIAAESYIVARVSLIVQLLIDQWKATFNTLALGGALAVSSSLSAMTILRRVLTAAIMAATSVLSAQTVLRRLLTAATVSVTSALSFGALQRLYRIVGTISASSYITARVALIVQLLIDQWKATFNTLALGGAVAATSALSAMTRLRQVLSAAAIAVISSMSGAFQTVSQAFYYAAGMIAATSEMSVASIQRWLITAGSVVSASVMSAQTSLRRLMTAATITATSALSLSAVIMRQMFAGLVSSASSLLGKLQYIGGIITVLLAGMIESASDISFASLIERLTMAGSLAVVSAFSGAARLVRVFFGAIASTSSLAFGTLRRTFLISGTIRAVSSFVALAIQGATAVIVTVHRLIRPIALLMGRIRGDKRNITK